MSENEENVAPAVMKAPAGREKLETENSGNFDSGIDEESIMERISKLKLWNENGDEANNNKSAKKVGKDGNSTTENSTTTNETERKPSVHDKKEDSGGVLSENEDDAKSKPESPKESQTPQSPGMSPGRMSPAEFFQSSRLRSSALANKLSTTQTFGGSAEITPTTTSGNDNASSDVEAITKGVEGVALNEKSKDETKCEKDGQIIEKDDPNKSDNDENQPDLIGRSPVPGYINRTGHAHHPYQQQAQQPKYSPCQASPSRGYYQMKGEESWSYSPANYMEQQRHKAGAQCCPSRPPCQQQPQHHVMPPANYYECGTYNNTMWSAPPNHYQHQQPIQQRMVNVGHQNVPEQYVDISPPSSVINSMAEMCQLAAKNSPLPVLSPFDLGLVQPTDGSQFDQLLEEKSASLGKDGTKEVNAGKAIASELELEELPDELCDFILTYSRHYSNKSEMAISADASNPGSVASEDNGGGQRSETCTPSTVTSGYESAISDGRSPAAASEGNTVGDALFSPSSAFYTNSPNAYSPYDGKDQKSPSSHFDELENSVASSARQRLRDRIEQKDLDAALAWAMRCCQSRPEALFFRDKDGDSLLHIVIWHKDLAKIYVLTEIMLKNAPAAPAPKLFDLPNRLNETPLFLAVEKGLNEVVAYLIECGADANVRPRHGDADPPLHYAATRGMSDIVQTLTGLGKSGVNVLNDIGLTPLLCAVKNHGNLDEESRCMVNNSLVIKALLKAGADPNIQDASSGKNVLHYCVDRMDPSLIQLFGDTLDRGVMARLVNTCDYNADTPLSMLTGAAPGAGGPEEEKLRQKMSKLLLEYSVGSLSADEFGDLSYLLSDQVPADGVQFAVLDSFLSSEAY